MTDLSEHTKKLFKQEEREEQLELELDDIKLKMCELVKRRNAITKELQELWMVFLK